MDLRSFCRLLPQMLLLIVLVVAGCSKGSSDTAKDVKVGFSVKPSPPKVGPATATVELTDKDGKPIKGATLKLEGNMNHAGMTPVFANAKEVDPGKYQATLDLTMGGDWFVLITGTLPDGRKLKRKVDMPGVESKQ